MTARRNFPARIRKAAYERAGGKCEECGCDLTGKRFDVDHAIPDAIGGEPTLANAVCLCPACHLEKTRLVDIPRAAKCKRQARKQGVARETNPVRRKGRPLQGRPFDKSLTRKFNGQTVRREP